MELQKVRKVQKCERAKCKVRKSENAGKNMMPDHAMNSLSCVKLVEFEIQSLKVGEVGAISMLLHVASESDK